MILQSLVEYYESLVRQGKIPRMGWSDVKVSYALEIDLNGNLLNVIDLQQQSGKKMVPRLMILPTHEKRSSGVCPNFLCDNSGYFLGFDNKGKPERARKCFKSAAELHKKILGDVDNSVASAVIKFFQIWDLENAEDQAVLGNLKKEIVKGGNIVFLVNGKFAHDDETIRNAWDAHLNTSRDEKKIKCMITGRDDVLALKHPDLKGIRGAQTSGASLVSFNQQAFSSFLKTQGENAQSGEYAAFAYGAALDYLVRTGGQNYIGDTAVLFYSVNGDSNYQQAFQSLVFGNDDYYSEEDLRGILTNLCRGKSVMYQESSLDPDMEFCVLGLAPNNARLSVRFFYRNSFGNILKNVEHHQNRMEICGKKNHELIIPIWRIVQETYREGGKPSPVLAGEIVRSIIVDGRYPSTLMNAIDLRIRADHKINSVRAATIKAYYLKNKNQYVPKEVLTMGLNKEAADVAYNLGRLFAILEKIQKDASPGINATIKDKFFGSASATPATTFPNLINLSQKHLRKLKETSQIYYNRLIGEVSEKIDEFPNILSMPQRGTFILGYYHQNQELYKSKEVNEGVKED